MFTDLVDDERQAVQANQFVIVDHGVGAIIDPGGNLAYNELFMALSRWIPPQNLSFLIASHADPDIIASLDRWMTSTKKLVISRIWERFAPHFTARLADRDWLENLRCGIDLFDERNYQLPTGRIDAQSNRVTAALRAA